MENDPVITQARTVADAMLSLGVGEVLRLPAPVSAEVMDYVYQMVRGKDMAWRMERERLGFWEGIFHPSRTDNVVSAARYL